MLVVLPKILLVLDLSKGIYIWLIVIVIIKIFNVICGYVYYKKLIQPHTIANKITGFALFVAPLIIGYVDLTILEILLCILATFSAIQEGHYIRTRKDIN